MVRHGAEPSVVLHHDAETLPERGVAVACGHAFRQVVDERQAGVVQRLGLLHDADAPVEVGGVAVAQVVGHHAVAPGEEGLVADQHALAEALPRQHVGGGKAAHAQEVAFAVHQFRLAIEHVGQLRLVDGVRHPQQGVVFVEAVAGVEEAEVVARGQPDAFVHGVVQPPVRLAHYDGDAFAVAVDDAHGAVVRRAVYDDVFHVVVRLRDDAQYGVFDDRLRVAAHGDDAELWGEMVNHGVIVFRSACYRGRCIAWPRCLPSNGSRLCGRLARTGCHNPVR